MDYTNFAPSVSPRQVDFPVLAPPSNTTFEPVLPPSSSAPPTPSPMEPLAPAPVDPSPSTDPAPLPPIHPMQTRLKSGIRKPNPRYANLHTVSHIPSEPKSLKSALKHPGWHAAMLDEMHALAKNNTWSLVARTPSMHVIGNKWIYKSKLKSDGSLERLKARLVAKGFHQIDGVDFSETFSPVIKPGTIRLVLTIAISLNWSIRQLDVKNAFLHGTLHETVYMEQPPGFIDPKFSDYVCKLDKALYGLKQAPRAWFDRFSKFLLTHGFFCSLSDPSLFICHQNGDTLVLLLYVDDIIFTGSNIALLNHYLALLSHEFDMKDLGPLHYFLGIQVTPTTDGLFLSQAKYAGDILKRADMLHCKPTITPMSTKGRTPITEEPLSDPSPFRSLVGALQYLTLTRPDITYSVNYVSQFMHRPSHHHLQLVKRILRYIHGTLDHGLHLRRTSKFSLYAFSDADWAGCPLTRRSTTGYCTFLGPNCISWCAKKQATVSRSSTEAEYRAMAHTAAELTWITYLLRDLNIQPPKAPVLFCDNLSALYMTVNPVFHARSKHIALDYHYVREQVSLGLLRTRHLSSSQQIADMFTKPLPRGHLQRLQRKLGLVPLPRLRGPVNVSDQSPPENKESQTHQYGNNSKQIFHLSNG